MPRYYLHICNGTGFVEDSEGQVLPNAEAARKKAIEALREIMAEELRAGDLNMASFIEIEDEQHGLITTVQFLDAVAVKTDRAQRRS